MNIVWAYKNTEDVMNNDAFGKHDERGGMPYTFNFMPATTAAPTVAPTTAPTVAPTAASTYAAAPTASPTAAATTAPTKGSSAMYVPSVCGIIALLLFQCVIGA